jgi:hypothetical protein
MKQSTAPVLQGEVGPSFLFISGLSLSLILSLSLSLSLQLIAQSRKTTAVAPSVLRTGGEVCGREDPLPIHHPPQGAGGWLEPSQLTARKRIQPIR